MAYTTGQADNYRHLYTKVIDHVTTGLGADNWTILRGQRNSLSKGYISNSSYADRNPMTWDESIAMGEGDYYQGDGNEDYLNHWGWIAYTTEPGGAYLGVEAVTTHEIYTYEIVSERTETSGGYMVSGRQLKSWVIEYSSNGSSWSTADTVTDEPVWTSGESRTYTIDTPVSAKYWRLRVTENQGDTTYHVVGRLRFKNSAGVTVSNAYSSEIVLRTEGYSGQSGINTFIRLRENATTGYFNFGHGSFIGWQSDTPIESQMNYGERYTLLNDGEIEYHMSANVQRLLLSSRVATTVSEFTYLGFFLPYATPEQYPYPYLNGGNAYESSLLFSYSETSSSYDYRHRNLQRPICSSSSNCAVTVWHYTNNVIVLAGGSYTSQAMLHPVFSTNAIHSGVGQNDDGTYNIIPYMIYSNYTGTDILGEVDGVYWVTGTGLAFGDTITVGGKDYLVFQNCFRSGHFDMACMVME